MSIVKQDAFGFTVGGSARGTELPQFDFQYETFGMKDAPAFALWAFRNGISQAATDAMALGKEAKLSDVIDSWNEKCQALQKGETPTSGSSGPRIGELERECRMVMVAKLTKAGMSNTDATKTAKNWKAFLSDKAAEKAKATGEDRATIFELACQRITDAAQAVLDARKTPTADDLV